jgi:hypothetical protein
MFVQERTDERAFVRRGAPRRSYVWPPFSEQSVIVAERFDALGRRRRLREDREQGFDFQRVSCLEPVARRAEGEIAALGGFKPIAGNALTPLEVDHIHP